MESFNVDHNLCIQCSLCIHACPFSLLMANEVGFPSLPEENVSYCFACGHCGAVCPQGAMVSPKSGGERVKPFPDLPDLGAVAVGKFLSSCRSIRRFKADPVPREEIMKILESARMAPQALVTVSPFGG